MSVGSCKQGGRELPLEKSWQSFSGVVGGGWDPEGLDNLYRPEKRQLLAEENLCGDKMGKAAQIPVEPAQYGWGRPVCVSAGRWRWQAWENFNRMVSL